MARGSSQKTPQTALVRTVAFPSSQLDSQHPIADLWALNNPLATASEEQRCFRDWDAQSPLIVDGRQQDSLVLRHSEMRACVDSRNQQCYAVAISRRIQLETEDGSQYGALGDYLLQDQLGSASIIRRHEFDEQFRWSDENEALPTAAVQTAEVRQALLEERWEDALLELQESGVANSNIQLRQLGETLLESVWTRASLGVSELRLAERVTDWLGDSNNFAQV